MDEWNGAFPSLKPSSTLSLRLLQVSAEGVQQQKVFESATSPSGSYLYLRYANKIYSVGDHLTVDYNSVNPPTQGFIYYMVRHVREHPYLLPLREESL